ncbi:peptidase T4 [Actinomyces trachealis]|uniref:peptidase T4 n=1 Tax=Actinomyces trachealis TaxID=2763540 RepID=UPI001C553804|nr:peptidase T4 [Actinomyces trachealis]
MITLRRALSPLRRHLGQEEGNASVEFLGWSVAVLVPVVYLVVALAQVQAASFATSAAAQSATRLLLAHPGAQGVALAHSSVVLTLTDQHIDAAAAANALTLECSQTDCAGGEAVARVAVGVDLPLLSSFGLGRDVVVIHATRWISLPAKEAQP